MSSTLQDDALSTGTLYDDALSRPDTLHDDALPGPDTLHGGVLPGPDRLQLHGGVLPPGPLPTRRPDSVTSPLTPALYNLPEDVLTCIDELLSLAARYKLPRRRLTADHVPRLTWHMISCQPPWRGLREHCQWLSLLKVTQPCDI
jgi:hypothetical protein